MKIFVYVKHTFVLKKYYFGALVWICYMWPAIRL